MAIELNMVSMLKQSLERKVKEAVINKIVQEQTETFEATLRARLEAEFEKLTMQGIENVHDFRRMRDELHIFMHWNGSESNIGKVSSRF